MKRFYVELLGFKNHDHDTSFDYLWVQTGNSSSLGFMPPMEGMGEPSPAKEPTIYLLAFGFGACLSRDRPRPSRRHR